jgi:hypothetical protein
MLVRRVALLAAVLLAIVLILHLLHARHRTTVEPAMDSPAPLAHSPPPSPLPPALPTSGEDAGADDAPFGVTVIVHVVDRAGAAIADARIDTQPPRFTDATGHATLHSSLPAQNLPFRVHADGYAAADVDVSTGDDPAAIVPVTVTLGPAARFGGVVLDDRDHPVPGAEIYAYVDDPHRVEFAHSDDRGRWTIDDIPPHARVHLSASTRLLVAAGEPAITTRTTPRDDITLRVEPGATIDGTVVDHAGHPVAGVVVELDRAHSEAAPSDDHGRFHFPCVGPGRNSIRAHTATLGTHEQIFNVPRRGHLDLRITLVDSSIAAVTTPDGHAVANVSVSVQGPGDDVESHDAVTDVHGRFDLGGLPPGAYRFGVSRENVWGTRFAEQIVSTGRRDLAIVIPAVSAIRGRVLLDGQPVSTFGVEVLPADVAHAIPQRDGRFTIDDVLPGEVSLVIVGPRFRRTRIDHITVSPDRPTDVGDIIVTAGPTLHGHVVDRDGLPVAGVAVVVQRGRLAADGADSFQRELDDARVARSDAAGKFTVVGLVDEVSGLTIQALSIDRGALPPRALTAADLAADVALTLTATGAIAGTIVGDPPGYISHEVDVREVGGQHSYRAYANDGRFRLAAVAPGDYIASIVDHPAAPVAFHVSAHRTSDVAIVVEPATVTVEVVITNRACSGATLRTPDGARALATASTCELVDVVPSRYLACTGNGGCALADIAASPPRQTIVVTDP